MTEIRLEIESNKENQEVAEVAKQLSKMPVEDISEFLKFKIYDALTIGYLAINLAKCGDKQAQRIVKHLEVK